VDFFEERVPGDICTAAAFHRWRENNEDRLMMSVEDVVAEDLEYLGIGGYPDQLGYERHDYALYYHVAPGERDDGVTIGVHVDQLPAFPEWLPAWGVDGDLEERAEILLRSLPKDFRRVCQPIASVAEGFAELWRYAPKDRPVYQALSEYVKDRTGAFVPVGEYDAERLPLHLRTKIWICDDEGEELAMGEDAAVLKLQLSDRMRLRFEAAANADVERKGISSWEGEALPERVTTPGGDAFPALVDEGTTVGVRAFSSVHEAAESHRAGGARLLWLAHPDQVNHLKKKFPLGMMAKVEMPRLGNGGTKLEDLILLAAEGAAGGAFPRSPDDFRVMKEKARGNWFDAAMKIGKAMDETLDLLPEIRTWVAKNKGDRNYGEIAADLEEELTWLLRGRFAWRTGFAGLRDYPRRLKAIKARLGRISSLPIVKDLEKMDRVRKLWTPWYAAWMAAPEDPKLWAHGWLLEEFRISVFAPEIPVTMKVSEKRIEESWRSIM
ncbi:MAG TPA: DUF3418 domain-containing protein, partial [Luteolibacter sp.]|nr:DUF3418 domain-containing protein [Luteolibacter sp.]